ncbi:MAG: hypothetical protein DWI28_05160 [Planctomycetota bacterium]|nr:MAG: hypothetical protein DWI28_05160 [Planctomycetota bacterium]
MANRPRIKEREKGFGTSFSGQAMGGTFQWGVGILPQKPLDWLTQISRPKRFLLGSQEKGLRRGREAKIWARFGLGKGFWLFGLGKIWPLGFA